MSWLLRFLLILLLIRALWRLLRGIIAGMAQAQGQGGTAAGQPVQLVRDPICGTFVVPARALLLQRGGETQYFCSERCRERYLSGAQR